MFFVDMAEAIENERHEQARKAYERAKALSQGQTAREATRTACRFSNWANPAHLQYKEVNREITKDMVKAIWPCPEGEIKKGRWKISRCLNEDIKQNAERIFLEVYGHPLHNADASLYFAKMLYMHFVKQRPVDFASKEVTVNTHDIREETVTFTRQELALIVEGAGLELAQVKQTLGEKLAEKEKEAVRLSQAQTPPPQANTRVEEQLNRLTEDVKGISDRLNPLRQGNHISHFLSHPELINEENVPSSSSGSQCPLCYKVFDGWSGCYMLPCGHYYHLVCLVRQMQHAPVCAICQAPLHKGLYTIFGMSTDYKPSESENRTPSVLRNLFQDEN